MKKMCAAGVVGILAANVAVSIPTAGHTDKMGAEKYHASAADMNGNEIQQVVIPVTPVSSRAAALGYKSAPKNEINSDSTGGTGSQNIANGNGTASNPGSTGGNGNTGNQSVPGGNGTTGKPDGADGSGTTGSSDGADGNGTTGSSNGTDGNGTSGGTEGTGGNGTQGTPDDVNGSEGTENPDTEDGNGTPENPDTEEGNGTSGNPDTGDGNGTPGNPDTEDGNETPEGSDNTNQPGNPEDTNQPDNIDGTGNPEQPDEPGNPGDSNQSGDSSKPGNTGKPDNSQNPSTSEKPGKPDSPGNQEKPNDSDMTKPSWPLDMKPGFGDNDNGIIDVTQFKPEKISPERIKNASLILNQKLVKLPKIVGDYRFWTVARKYAFAKENLIIRESIVPEEEEDDRIRAVGKLRKNGLLYILKEEEDGWLYVESGRVRGFVRSEEVITNEEAAKQLEIYQERAKKRAERLKQEYTGIEGIAPMARELLPWKENEAYTYLRATVNQTVVEKKYALAKTEDVEVMEYKDEESRIVGIIPQEGLCFILEEDEEEEWFYIESGDVRGFVKKSSIQSGEDITEYVDEKHEDSFPLAEEKIKAEENEACYYTLTSTKSGVPSGEIRRSMVEFAAQFVGNPYVWGGTSLTEGADCSGFVQSIYKQYGYELPRVSRDQAQYGTKIPVEDALPGDLIFYANNGIIHHVVMYAGEGKTIEAMSTDMGIVQADVSKNSAVWATRVLNDNGYEYAGGGIGDVNATKDMYGKNLGTFKLTYYCACELCCNIETGITATGAPVVEGRTIAVDPRVIPYGTQVIIGGHVFTAEDCGGAIKENHIDIYVNDHEEALALGVNYADVYLKK